MKEVDISKLQAQNLMQDPAMISEVFVNDYMAMIESVASVLSRSGKVPPCIDFDDLVSWGVEGLIKAKKNFKNDLGARFSTYAFYRVKGEMLDRVRSEWKYRNPVEHEQHRRRIREKVADAASEFSKNTEDAALSTSESVKGLLRQSTMVYVLATEDFEVESSMKGSKNPEVEAIDENNSVLWEEIQKLEGDERTIVELFYVQGLKQTEIADKLGYSKSKVCRVHMALLNKLRVRLNERYHEE